MTSSLSLAEIFHSSQAMYRLYVPKHFVCFSPERFVKIHRGKIFSHPMKGTIRADLPNAQKRLLENRKEEAEHRTIVDLTCADLARVSRSVKVNRFRYFDKLKTTKGFILQTSSEVEGTLPANDTQAIGTLFSKLLPASSILGSPRDVALKVIQEAEGIPRGFYTGVVGYFDGQSLDSGVLIRFMEEDKGKTYFRSGGGITIDSQAKEEYQEAIQKIYLPLSDA